MNTTSEVCPSRTAKNTGTVSRAAPVAPSQSTPRARKPIAMAAIDKTAQTSQAGITSSGTKGRKNHAVNGGLTKGGPVRSLTQGCRYMRSAAPSLMSVAAEWKALKSHPAGVPVWSTQSGGSDSSHRTHKNAQMTRAVIAAISGPRYLTEAAPSPAAGPGRSGSDRRR